MKYQNVKEFKTKFIVYDCFLVVWQIQNAPSDHAKRKRLRTPDLGRRKMRRRKLDPHFEKKQKHFELKGNVGNLLKMWKTNLLSVEQKSWGVIHKWRHAILYNFGYPLPPPPIVTRFITKALVLSSQNPRFPFPLRPWRHLWTTPIFFWQKIQTQTVSREKNCA